MPLKVVETTGLKHDGPIGEQLEDNRFILVCDRTYFSIDKVDRYIKDSQQLVFRTTNSKLSSSVALYENTGLVKFRL